jgi:hypothetical protein
MSVEPETGNVRLKNETVKRLGEDVGSVDNTRSVFDEKEFGFNVGANEVIPNVDVLCFTVIRVIGRKRFSSIVISADDEG